MTVEDVAHCVQLCNDATARGPIETCTNAKIGRVTPREPVLLCCPLSDAASSMPQRIIRCMVIKPC
jgi:hypothetical protein